MVKLLFNYLSFPNLINRPLLFITEEVFILSLSNLNKFHFVEFINENGVAPAYKNAGGQWVNGWTAKHFYIKLDDIPNYTDNTEIVTHINSKFASGEV